MHQCVVALSVFALLPAFATGERGHAELVTSADADVDADDALVVNVNASFNPLTFANEMVTEGCVGDHAVQYERLATELNLPRRTEASWAFGIKKYELNIEEPPQAVELERYLAKLLTENRPPDVSELESLHVHAQLPVLFKAVQDRFELEKELFNADKSARKQAKEELQQAKDLVKSYGYSVHGAKSECLGRQEEPRAESIAECMAQVIGNGTTYGGLGLKFGYRRVSAADYELKDLKNLKMLTADEVSALVEPLASKRKNMFGLGHEEFYDDDRERAEYAELVGLTKAAALEKSSDALSKLVELQARKEQRHDLLTKFTQSSYQAMPKVQKAVKRANAELQRVKSILKGLGFSFMKTRKACVKDRASESPKKGAELISRILMQNNDPLIVEGRKCMEKPGMYCSPGMAPKFTRKPFDFNKFVSTYMLGVVTWGNPSAVAIMGLGGLIVGGPAGAGMGVALALGTPTEWILPVPVALWRAAEFFPKCRCSINPCVYDQELNACTIKASSTSNPFGWLPHPGQKCVMKADEPSCTIQKCLAEDFHAETSLKQIRGTVGAVESGTRKGVRGVYNCLADDEDVALWLRPDMHDILPGLKYNSTDGFETTQAFSTVYEKLDPSHF